jgi:PPOX class probable F420-dependent enzyme
VSIAFDRAEREAFLSDVHVGVLSLTADGRGPLACPVWYAYEPGGEIVFVTGADSRKAPLLSVGARVSFLVQDESMPPRYVSVEGPVTSVETADPERDVVPIAQRYLGQEVGRQYVNGTRGGPDAPDEVVVRIRPERWLSADFAKRLAQG